MAIVACLAAAGTCVAQKKEINQAQTIIKSGKELDKAERLMTSLLTKEEHRTNPKIYNMWFQAVAAQYEAANTKLYLRQKYDTAQFFGLVRRMFLVAESLDSLDAQPDKKGRVRPEYRKRHAEQLDVLRPNLYYGGTYQMRKGHYDEAFGYFDTYLDAARQPLFTGYDYATTDTLMPQAAYWAVTCGYRLQKADSVLRYGQQALDYQPRREVTLQYLCEAYRWLADDSAYVATLRQGYDEYPEHPYFFPRLADWLTAQGRQEEMLALADRGLQVNADNQLFLLARSVALLNLGRNDACIETSERLIALNDTMPEAYFNIATVRLNEALALESENEPRKNRVQLTRLYQQARPYMEAYRQLAPDQQRRWAPALYRIYLYLNMGKQFDEIDRVLRKMK